MEAVLTVTFLLQCLLSSLASMMVGFLWHSELLFGRVWWRNTFPTIAFGDTRGFKEAGNLPLYMTMVATIIQNAILTYSVNTIHQLLPSSTCEGAVFPFTISLVVSVVIGCASFPHFVYSRKPFVLYLISAGHNLFQVTAAVFVIYYLISK